MVLTGLGLMALQVLMEEVLILELELRAKVSHKKELKSWLKVKPNIKEIVMLGLMTVIPIEI